MTERQETSSAMPDARFCTNSSCMRPRSRDFGGRAGFAFCSLFLQDSTSGSPDDGEAYAADISGFMSAEALKSAHEHDEFSIMLLSDLFGIRCALSPKLGSHRPTFSELKAAADRLASALSDVDEEELVRKFREQRRRKSVIR